MKRIYTKIVRNTFVVAGMVPISKEDVDRLNSFEDHQILKNQVSGVQKQRSVVQNNWIHAIFRFVADNTYHQKWNTPTKAKNMTKLAIGFYEEFGVMGDKVFFQFKSFNFQDMDHNEANRVYNEAKDVCALFLGVDPGELEAEAKKKAGYR